MSFLPVVDFSIWSLGISVCFDKEVMEKAGLTWQFFVFVGPFGLGFGS